jgi:L-asparaginase II
MGFRIVAEVTRGAVVESVHHGAWVVVDAAGEVVSACGDPGLEIFPRSSLKPFQAVPLLEVAHRHGWRLEPREWAIACASHGGTPQHLLWVEHLLERVDRARAVLAPAGDRRSAWESLVCGRGWPLDEATAEAMRRDGAEPACLHHNCSGKHAAMMLAAAGAGWEVETYAEPGHPLQVAIGEGLARFAGERPFVGGVDGCGVPAWVLSLRGLATAFAALGHSPELAPLRQAMQEFPELVASTGRFDTDLMHLLPGRLVAKAGAEGVHAGVDPVTGLAWALKIADGNRRAVAPVVVNLLCTLGILDRTCPEVRDWFEAPVRRASGTLVGSVRAVASRES